MSRAFAVFANLMALQLLAFAAVSGAEARIPPTAELRKMIATCVEYQGLSPAERATAMKPLFAQTPLSKKAAAEWSQALRQAWLEHLKSASPPTLDGSVFPDSWAQEGIRRCCVQADYWETPTTKSKLTMRYGAITIGAKPEKGWPVYINLHGGGTNAGQNDGAWQYATKQYPIEQGLYICPRSVVNTPESWADPHNQVLLEQLLAELPAAWEIDPNRVYVFGHSMGGWGTFHLGPCMPDRWAAIASSSGAGFVGATGRCAPDNLRNLPHLIQIGTLDKDYGRYPLSKAFADALRRFHEQDTGGYVVEYREHPGKGHQIDDRDTPKWLSQFSRNPIPERVVWQQPISKVGNGVDDFSARLSADFGYREYFRTRCYWLKIDAPAPYQRAAVSRKENTFLIESSKYLKQLTILLDDRLADLDQPVRVMYGSKELIKTKVARTVTTLITTLVEYRDPELMFCGELQIQAPDGVAELEKRRLATAAEFAERAQDRIAVKRYDEAAADLEAALKLDPKPDAFAALKILGQIFSVQKDEAKLLDAEQRMADARPTDLPSQYIFAMQLMLTERKDLRNDQLALRYAERVLELSQPRNPQFMVAPALAYFRNGRKNDAINLIKEALAMLKPGEQSTLRAGLEKYLQEFSADAAATP